MKYIFLLQCSLLATFVFGQSTDELDKRNGFKDIQVNTAVADYEGLEYKKDEEHPFYEQIKVYVSKKGYYESIGNIKIYDLEVLTFRDSIFQIKVITEKEPALINGMQSVFGEPIFDVRKAYHHWNGKNLRLSYKVVQRNKFEFLYESFLMRNKLKEAKEEAIEDIVSDF